MGFTEKLNALMEEMNLTQAKVAALTGISKPNISQYVNGKHEPTEERRKEMARALGVKEDYFEVSGAMAEIIQDECINLKLDIAAKLMHKSRGWIEKGLQDGVFPWGYAVFMKEWSYWINARKFAEYERVKLPNELN